MMKKVLATLVAVFTLFGGSATYAATTNAQPQTHSVTFEEGSVQVGTTVHAIVTGKPGETVTITLTNYGHQNQGIASPSWDVTFGKYGKDTEVFPVLYDGFNWIIETDRYGNVLAEDYVETYQDQNPFQINTKPVYRVGETWKIGIESLTFDNELDVITPGGKTFRHKLRTDLNGQAQLSLSSKGLPRGKYTLMLKDYRGVVSATETLVVR